VLEVHVLTVPSRVPDDIADAIFTAVERALVEAGATRVWIDPARRPEAAVMAEFDRDAEASA